MAQAIISILKGNDNRAEKIERSKLYVQRFENLNVAEQVEEVYNQLLQQGR